MNARRAVLLVTCLVVAGLGGLFAASQWDRANQIATLVSALAAVAAVGVALWAALPGSGTTVRVSRTGPATAGPGALDVADLAESEHGLRVRLRRSKTDQEAGGDVKGIPWGSHPETCPVRALRAWLEASQITEGPLFRAVDRHGRLSSGRLGIGQPLRS